MQTLHQGHAVYVADWKNARDAPLAAGRVGMDDFVACLIRFLDAIGPGAHMLAVCQPCVQALAAAAVMAEDDHPAQPRSITLMAGPVDVSECPTEVNELANKRPISWFRSNLIARAPGRCAGAGRRVYPGFVRLASVHGDEHGAPQRGASEALRPSRGERDGAGAKDHAIL